MPHFTYFAYGSNMLTERLTDRCPSAVAVGRAVAHGFQLEFSKRSVDGSGKGTLIRREQAEAHGVLFSVDIGERGALDAFEGTDYLRVDEYQVTDMHGAVINATTYLAKETVNGLLPYDWYLAVVLAGARQNDLPAEYIATLMAFAHRADPNQDRKTRQAAIAALKAARISDFRTLLDASPGKARCARK